MSSSSHLVWSQCGNSTASGKPTGKGKLIVKGFIQKLNADTKGVGYAIHPLANHAGVLLQDQDTGAEWRVELFARSNDVTNYDIRFIRRQANHFKGPDAADFLDWGGESDKNIDWCVDWCKKFKSKDKRHAHYNRAGLGNGLSWITRLAASTTAAAIVSGGPIEFGVGVNCHDLAAQLCEALCGEHPF